MRVFKITRPCLSKTNSCIYQSIVKLCQEELMYESDPMEIGDDVLIECIEMEEEEFEKLPEFKGW